MRRVVIAGLPRCGTTLLATLLQQQRHSHFVTDYVNWARDASRRLGRLRGETLSNAEKRVTLALARDAWLRLRQPILTGLDGFRTIDELDIRISTEIASIDTRTFGYKTLLSPDEIGAMLRDTSVHVIVMVRDPRDAALSYYGRVGSGVEAYVSEWRSMVRYCRRAKSNRLLWLEFEKLVTDPIGVLSQLQRWWPDPMHLPTAELRFHQGDNHGVEWSGNSSFFDVTAGSFDRRTIGRWRSYLASPIVQYADYSCRAEIAELGLEPLPTRSVRTDLRMGLHASYWRFDQWLDATTKRARKRLKDRLALPMVIR